MGLDGGNWSQAEAHKANAATQHANAAVARAQGRAAKAQAYGQAARAEAENAVAGQQASMNLARLRAAQNAAQGALRTQRAATGITSEGSALQQEESLLTRFERQAGDMAYSRSLQDQSVQFGAVMARRSGDIAEMGGMANAAYADAQAGISSMQARNANRAGNITFGTTVGASLLGAYFGGPAGAFVGAQLGQGVSNLYTSGQVGSVQSQGSRDRYNQKYNNAFGDAMAFAMQSWLT